MLNGTPTAVKLTIIEQPTTDDTSPIINGVLEYGLDQIGGVLPKNFAIHGKIGNELVGGATGRQHFTQFYLDNLWVHQNFRSKGYGTIMHDSVLELAANLSCSRIQLNTLNIRAVAFYKNLGYETLAIIGEYVDGFDLYYLSISI